MCWLPLILLASTVHLAVPRDSRDLEKMNTMELVSAFGQRAEEHTVITDDGYILKLHRLSGLRRRFPVLVMHGVLGRSDMWVLQGPSSDLAFKMAEAGYDVWLGNVRGNTYGKSHVYLNPSNDSFWEFSWHEMGYYDLPAIIDYILGWTHDRQLFYIGHSMGTTMFFAMASSRPEYNSKVRAFIGLAPVVFHLDYPSFYKRLAKYREQIYETFKKQHIHEMWPRMPWLASTEANLCRDGSPVQSACMEIIFSIFGRNQKQLNTSLLPMVIEHLASVNPRTIVHYGHNINSGRFQWFNFGPSENLRLYGSIEPPDYDLSLVTAPVLLYYSNNDFLSYEKDVRRLAKQLPNLLGVLRVPYKQFNHIDYLWAKDAYRILYKDIIRLLNKMSKNIFIPRKVK